MSDTEIVEVGLPGGTILLVRAERIGQAPAVRPGPSDVGLRDILSFKHVAASVRGISRELHKALDAARPERVTVELGFDLAVKGSQVLALIADAGSTASVTIKLEWGPGSRAGAPGEPGEDANEDDEDEPADGGGTGAA